MQVPTINHQTIIQSQLELVQILQIQKKTPLHQELGITNEHDNQKQNIYQSFP